jgi:hypothetical protein
VLFANSRAIRPARPRRRGRPARQLTRGQTVAEF